MAETGKRFWPARAGRCGAGRKAFRCKNHETACQAQGKRCETKLQGSRRERFAPDSRLDGDGTLSEVTPVDGVEHSRLDRADANTLCSRPYAKACGIWRSPKSCTELGGLGRHWWAEAMRYAVTGGKGLAGVSGDRTALALHGVMGRAGRPPPLGCHRERCTPIRMGA